MAVSQTQGSQAHGAAAPVDVAGFIDQHEFIAYATTAIFLALSIWRSRAMRRGSDVGGSWVYGAFSVAGLLALVLTGALGGKLVFGHGVGISH